MPFLPILKSAARTVTWGCVIVGAFCWASPDTAGKIIGRANVVRVLTASDRILWVVTEVQEDVEFLAIFTARAVVVLIAFIKRGTPVQMVVRASSACVNSVSFVAYTVNASVEEFKERVKPTLRHLFGDDQANAIETVLIGVAIAVLLGVVQWFVMGLALTVDAGQWLVKIAVQSLRILATVLYIVYYIVGKVIEFLWE